MDAVTLAADLADAALDFHYVSRVLEAWATATDTDAVFRVVTASDERARQFIVTVSETHS